MYKIFAVFLLVLLAFPARAGETASVPQVVVSIAPLAGIAAAVMEGVGTPALLVQGNASPHTYQLRPSDAQNLARADLVLWVGPTLESFMKKSVPAAKSMALLENARPAGQGTTLLHNAEDEHGHGHDHDHGHYDPHLWLNPYNAVAIARQLATRLGELDNANAARYQANAHAFAQALVGLDADINTRLAPHKAKPFIVFHDAYQYFIKRYELNFAGAISLSPEVAPSAKKLAALQQDIKAKGVVCVLAEPQFKAAVVDTLVKDTPARKGMVNPDASDLPLNPQLYFAYLQRMANDFIGCLGG